MLGESLMHRLRPSTILRKKQAGTDPAYFWALKDVSFEVGHGEVLGILGHNGAGKSTLLKILSRITEPTAGYADIYGRVGSLLEVGTGFHLELSGRENILLSGAIMGMSRDDIKNRFDEIVDFAGVARFIDTPVKHYSSGMHLRLAFAVAAHLEPEILLVDEVLAVGDMEFQRKCLNKMENVAGQGRTVLFVSHNLGSVKELCKTSIVLKHGKVDFSGSVVDGIRHYSRNVLNAHEEDHSGSSHQGWIKIRLNSTSDSPDQVGNDESFKIAADLRLTENNPHAVLHLIMEDAEGNQVVHNYLRLKDRGRSQIDPGVYRVSATVPPLYLKPGVYTLYLKFIADGANFRQAKYVSERLVVSISDNTGMYAGKIYATILPPVEWSIADRVPEAAPNPTAFIENSTVF